MIYAKTKMRKIPKSCKDCAYAKGIWGGEKSCRLVEHKCPWVQTEHGNWKYSKPKWCPLVEVNNNDRP